MNEINDTYGPIANVSKGDISRLNRLNWNSPDGKKYLARRIDIDQTFPTDTEKDITKIGSTIKEAYKNVENFAISIAPYSILLDDQSVNTTEQIQSSITFRHAYAVVEEIPGKSLEDLFKEDEPRAISISVGLIGKLLEYKHTHRSLFLSEIYYPKQFVVREDSSDPILVDIEPKLISKDSPVGNPTYTPEIHYRNFEYLIINALYVWLSRCKVPKDHELYQRMRAYYPEYVSRMEQK